MFVRNRSGPELIIQFDGLAKAQPMESFKGTLVKPGFLKEPLDDQATWVQGESSNSHVSLVVGPPVSAVAPTRAMVISGLPVVLAASPVRATVGSGSSVVLVVPVRATVGSRSPAVSATSPARATVVFGLLAVSAALPASVKVVSGLSVTTATSASAMGGPFLGFLKWRGLI